MSVFMRVRSHTRTPSSFALSQSSRRRVGLSFALAAMVALTSACGGGEPPKAPEGQIVEVGDASLSGISSETTVAPDSGVEPSAAAPSSADSAGAAPAGTAPAASAAPAEAPDECGAVAAPFEEKVRAKFNECYQAGKKKNPELAGTIRVTLKINVHGKIAKVTNEPSQLDKPVVDCMVKAVKKEPLDTKTCLGKDITVSKTYGGR